MFWLFGRECKVGWGYHYSSGQLNRIEGNPPDYQSIEGNSSFIASPSTITCGNPPILNLTELIEERCRKYLDFCLLFDEQEYWITHCCIYRKFDDSEQFLQYPQNSDWYVNTVFHGIELRIIFPKQGLPNNSQKVEDLLDSRNLDDAQKQISCKVLINFDEVREMALEELLQYIKKLKSGEDSLSDIPISFGVKSLYNLSYKPITITKSQKLNQFLHHLYYIFRKTEIKLEKEGYSNIVDALRLKEELPLLQEAKNAYRLIDKSNFPEMYPVIKQLFCCYVKYVKDSLDRYIDITEGDRLPGTIDELKNVLQELNNGNSKMYIGSCPGYEHAIEQLRQTKKFKDWNIVENDKNNQPFICLIVEKVLFGFVDMEGAIHTEIPKDALPVTRECPTGCTNESRKWICRECGDFVLIKDLILYCSCGSKNFEDILLICVHESHRKCNAQESSVLITPAGYDHVLQKLRRSSKYATIHVIEDAEAHEPYIREPSEEKHIFGFVDMSGADPGELPENRSLLEIECPLECNNNSRRWICTTCGDFVSYSNWVLYCSCGSKKFKEKLLSCHHLIHKSELSPEVRSLIIQLQKITLRATDIDPKIPETIQVLSTSTDKNTIIRTVRGLKGPFDGDTQHLIEQIVSDFES